MKQVVRIILAAAALAALAVPAMAAPGDVKLIVKNDGGTADVFKVDNNGIVLGAKLGMGTTAPQVPIHLHLPTALGAVVPAGTSLYSTATGFSASTQDNSASADFVVSDGTATAGMRGVIRGVRSRGTLAAPTVPLTDDMVVSLIGGIWDGTKVWNTADITFKVDGPVATSAAPQRIVFSTRNNGAGAYIERLVVKNNGNVIVGLAGVPIYADNTAAASLATGTLYRTATGTLMIKY